MTAPTTFRGEPGGSAGIDWEAPATLHRRDDGGGLLYDFKAIRSGTLAALVRQIMALPPGERQDYAIEKAGDHRLEYNEIASLAARSDFPRV